MLGHDVVADIAAIAEEAYIYGYPMVDRYKAMSAASLWPKGSEERDSIGTPIVEPPVFRPAGTVIRPPMVDAPHGMTWFDLRREPLVLSLPPIEAIRYFVVQFVDLYTHTFEVLGTRTSGNNGGRFLLAGPSWKGSAPAGIVRVLRSETEFVFSIFRAQLFTREEPGNVKAIQERISVQPLSEYSGSPAPAPPPAVRFPAYDPAKAQSIEFFGYLNFLLQFCPTHPSEEELRARFAVIGIQPGQPFTPDPGQRQAIADGIERARRKVEQALQRRPPSSESSGTREHLQNNYLSRAAAARKGIYAVGVDEAVYPSYQVDATGATLDGKRQKYVLRFTEDQLPWVDACWCVTLYKLPDLLMARHPINPHLINSPMLSGLTRDADGGVTIYVQKDYPGPDLERNWLPVPAGPFAIVLRLFGPRGPADSAPWTLPPLMRL